MSLQAYAAPERVVARVRSHARALIIPAIVLIATCGGFGYLGGTLPELWQNLAVAGIAVALGVVGWVVPLAAWLSRNYTVTTRRTVLRSGVVVRTRQEILHYRVVDVTVRKGALQSLFGSGDVLIGLGTSRPVVLRDVPSPDLVADAIHELVERARPDGDSGQFG